MRNRQITKQTAPAVLAPPGPDEIVVLADVSSSMSERDAGDGRARIALLKDALGQLPRGIRIIAFSSGAQTIARPKDLPRPFGNTRLDLGIHAAALYKPIRSIIISDGEPDNQERARKALERLTGIVDVIYCGDPDNAEARAFLQSLARIGEGGYYETGDQPDIAKQLPAVVRGLLGPGKKP